MASPSLYITLLFLAILALAVALGGTIWLVYRLQEDLFEYQRNTFGVLIAHRDDLSDQHERLEEVEAVDLGISPLERR